MTRQEMRDKWDAEERRERDLLEAAPDILEALKTILNMKIEQYKDTFDSRMDNDEIVMIARAAIAKAEGGVR